MILRLTCVVAVFVAISLAAHAELKSLPQDVTRVPVVFSGGHETEGQDGGRPVVLIAGALGVAPEVFRDAFSLVHPAGPDRGPTGDEARQNKGVLMAALGIYGITNDELDRVSNRYRYVRSRGEMWTHQEAIANALIKDGKVIGYEVIDPGYGYSSAPIVFVPGMKDPPVIVELSFGMDVEKNGSVSAITLQGK